MANSPPTLAQLREGGVKKTAPIIPGLGSNLGVYQKAGQQGIRDAGYSLGYIPPAQNTSPTLGDLLKQRMGGGGGGGYDPYAAQRAADERRRAAMRAAIEQQYGGAIGSLQDVNHQTMMGLGGFYNDAVARQGPIWQQNQALQSQYGRQLADVAQNASRGVLDQGDMLQRDLQAQGAGVGGLQGRISGDVRDILGARSAGDQYNTRLAQVMALAQAGGSDLLSAILQGAQSQRENAYTQQLAQLQAEQAMKMAELA